MLNDRFWTKVRTTNPTECWEWTANKNNKGYGLFRPGGIAPKKLAHRLSYEESFGSIPKGMVVMHTCDNPACVNPSHLIAGTQKQNMQDAAIKERGGNTNLDGAEVISLLKDYVAGLPRKEIAAKHGISNLSVNDYTSGKSWKHLHGKHGCPTLAELKAASRTTPIAEDDVREIWKLHFTGKSAPEIAKIVGHSIHSIDGIVLGKTWRHLPGAPTRKALKSGGVHPGFNQFSRGANTRDIHPLTKIPSSEIPSIIRRIDAGETYEAVGRTYGVKKTAIWRINKAR